MVHPLPGSAEQLADKLREVGEKLRTPQTQSSLSRSSPIVPGIPPLVPDRNSLSGSSASGSLSQGSLGISIGSRFDHGIGSSQVSQIEVGPSHFAFLLSDGRICRLPFSVISDRLDLSRPGAGIVTRACSCPYQVVAVDDDAVDVGGGALGGRHSGSGWGSHPWPADRLPNHLRLRDATVTAPLLDLADDPGAESELRATGGCDRHSPGVG